jgi:hypothetical protein
MFSAQAATGLDVAFLERRFVYVLPLAAVADTDAAKRVQRLDDNKPAVALIQRSTKSSSRR